MRVVFTVTFVSLHSRVAPGLEQHPEVVHGLGVALEGGASPPLLGLAALVALIEEAGPRRSTCWDGGAGRAWHGWRYDGTPTGVDLGHFGTAEEAMAAVDDAI